MEIIVKRYKQTDDATLGKLFVDGEFECYTIEDGHRDIKVPGETRIPAGTYSLVDRQHGGFYKRYTQRWDWHDGMIQLAEVPGFEHILIHCGNTSKDSHGCLLVGTIADEKTMFIGASRIAYEKLYKKIYETVCEESVLIEIVDPD